MADDPGGDMPAVQQELDVHPIIRDAAEALDAAIQAREYSPVTLHLLQDVARELREHRAFVAGNHKTMQAVLDLVPPLVEQVTQNSGRLAQLESDNAALREDLRHAREDYELEVKVLHSTMRDWHRAQLDDRLAIENALEHIGVIAKLPPPASLSSHYIKERRKAS